MNELYHYGIPGMKWGVRRKRENQSDRAVGYNTSRSPLKKVDYNSYKNYKYDEWAINRGAKARTYYNNHGHLAGYTERHEANTVSKSKVDDYCRNEIKRRKLIDQLIIQNKKEKNLVRSTVKSVQELDYVYEFKPADPDSFRPYYKNGKPISDYDWRLTLNGNSNSLIIDAHNGQIMSESVSNKR